MPSKSLYGNMWESSGPVKFAEAAASEQRARLGADQLVEVGKMQCQSLDILMCLFCWIFIAFVFAKSLASLAPSSFRFQTCLCKIATNFFATRVIWFYVIKKWKAWSRQERMMGGVGESTGWGGFVSCKNRVPRCPCLQRQWQGRVEMWFLLETWLNSASKKLVGSCNLDMKSGLSISIAFL